MSKQPRSYVRVYDTSLTLLAEVDNFADCYFERSLADAGKFQITINYNLSDATGAKYADYFQLGRFVTIGDDLRRVGVILEVTKAVGPEGKGSQKVSIKGSEAKVLFGRRVVIPPGGSVNYTQTAVAETVIKDVVKASLGSTATASRQMAIFTIAASQGRGSSYEFSSRYKNLADDIRTICQATGIGVSNTLAGSTITIDTIHGVDRTINQSTNARAVISTEYDTLEEATLTESEIQYRNLVIAAGQGVGTSRNVQTVYDGSEPTGIERREVFQDMRDLDSTAKLQARAAEILSAKNVTKFIDGKALTFSTLELGVDYDLGDYVTIQAYDQSEDVQITKVKESWGYNKYNVDLIFNRSYPEQPQEIRSRDQELVQTFNNTEIPQGNIFFPIGSYYTQYPNASSNTDSVEFPTSQTPAVLFGGTWVEQWNTESIFFRTRGTASDSGRTSGLQGFAMQGHSHAIKFDISTIINGSNGAGANNTQLSFGNGVPNGTLLNLNIIGDGVNGTPSTAAETRPTNRRIKVWKRTA